MIATERLLSEERFHDVQAEERALRFENDPSRFQFDDEAYLDHETWIRPAFTSLGNLAGRRFLDYGCGHGMAAVVAARHGAHVTGFDLSSGYLEEARRRAAANNVVGRFLKADAEHLPFDDNSFDAIWGCAILHHLDLNRAGLELQRILRPGGRAAFCEPWGGNPILNFARRFVPYPGKQRTPDERPLTRDDLAPLRAIFPNMRVKGYQLLGMFRRALCRVPHAGGLLDRADRALLQRLPRLENSCRYVVLSLER